MSDTTVGNKMCDTLFLKNVTMLRVVSYPARICKKKCHQHNEEIGVALRLLVLRIFFPPKTLPGSLEIARREVCTIRKNRGSGSLASRADVPAKEGCS